jgi:hypothetical protein
MGCCVTFADKLHPETVSCTDVVSKDPIVSDLSFEGEEYFSISGAAISTEVITDSSYTVSPVSRAKKRGKPKNSHALSPAKSIKKKGRPRKVQTPVV